MVHAQRAVAAGVLVEGVDAHFLLLLLFSVFFRSCVGWFVCFPLFLGGGSWCGEGKVWEGRSGGERVGVRLVGLEAARERERGELE